MPGTSRRTLNPFRRVDDPRGVFAWAVYDLANQSFQLLINTLLFALYIKQVVAPDPASGQRLWSAMSASALLAIVILSPITGAIADQRAWKRELLLLSGIVCAALTACLALVGPGHVALAFALYTVAAIACGLGENFLGSFLPEISTPANVGFVSALGWTTSYVGALSLLGVTALYCFALGHSTIDQARPLFVFAGVWFALGTLPALFFLRERARPQPTTGRGFVLAAAARLADSARHAVQFRQLTRLLTAFFVYTIGTMTVIYFLGVIGDALGFGLPQLVLMSLVVALTAGGSAAVTGRVQDRLGHRRTIAALLVLWIIAAATMALAQALALPAGAFWVIGGMIGAALGGIGTASRAAVGAFTPPQRAGEVFGLWGMAAKLAGILGVLSFGWVSASFGMPAALWLLTLFFAAGLVLLLRVDEAEGVHAAHGTTPERRRVINHAPSS
jgi:UMF1 family MFS transporter